MEVVEVTGLLITATQQFKVPTCQNLYDLYTVLYTWITCMCARAAWCTHAFAWWKTDVFMHMHAYACVTRVSLQFIHSFKNIHT